MPEISTICITFAIFSVLYALVFMLTDVRKGKNIARCSEPIYLLLDLINSCASVIVDGGGRYTEAVKISKQVSELGLPLRNMARFAASEFGGRKNLRKTLKEHAEQVEATFIEAADGLVRDRDRAVNKLAKLAAASANGIAEGRFLEVLPDTDLVQESALEPDRLDGRRLATACIWSLIAVMATGIVLSPFGISSALVIPLMLVGFIVTVYVILAFRHGLAEATRLTRNIGSFFTPGPSA
ncbi:hypothetical protein ACFWBR_38120 [Streptomyces sp. NPDC060006]|uniref:hypothetical protein n=1 Tax=unclassified Streptomyces TaxID=2593676 RepID=UPI0036BAD385